MESGANPWAAPELEAGLTEALPATLRRVAAAWADTNEHKPGAADLLEAEAAQLLATIRAERAARHPLTPSGALLEGLLADHARRRALIEAGGDGITGLRTGLGKLDDRIGGLEGGTVTLLAARPNIGKTTLANQWAYEIAKSGAPVLYLTLENPPEDLTRKQLTRLAGERATDVLRGKADPRKLEDAARTYAEQVGDRLYYVAGTARTDVDEIRGLAERVRRRHETPEGTLPPVLVCVDYLQKLAAQDDADEIRRGVARLAQELRDLARDLESPVLAIASVNRAAYATEGKRPGMHNLKESGDLEYAADTVLMLSEEAPEGEQGGTVPPPGFRALWLEIAKNRYGETGRLPLLFNAANGRFAPRDPEAPTILDRALGRAAR